ncbi:hypothetical protein [Raineya orbicola]|uniref:Lipoprotein n=1 Tax=Raineya orbicola TaxID=2016530 RepID=A0A2N3IJZ9_9BACT|nr:hypothetical protein [Raineya orbicola]PKQ70660.1 hypothetical protein Rain11_0390 [Raineya orbicola]
MKNFLYGAIFLLFSACYKSQEPNNNVSYYYDLTAFLQKLYAQKGGFYLKTTFTENQKQQKKIENIRWEKELAFFEQTNINKSAFKDLYDERREQKGDTLILQYQAKNSDLKVKFLEIKFDKNQTPIQIKAFLQTENYLYASEKELNLYLKDEKVLRYSIKGKQKMIFAEAENFEIYAEKVGDKS